MSDAGGRLTETPLRREAALRPSPAVVAQHRKRFDGKWEVRCVHELAHVDPENLPNNTRPNFRFNYISLENVHAGHLHGWSSESFETAPSRARRVVQPGDVLMSTVRPALQGHLLYQNQVPNAVCSTGFAVLRARRDLSDPRFLFAHLFAAGVSAQLQQLLAGSNYPAITGGDAERIRIPCPPTVTEQRAIAAVLSDVDELIGSLEALIAKKRAIKQGTMQALLTGRTRLPGFGGEWEIKRLEEIAVVTMGQSPPSASYNEAGDGLPLIQGNADIVRRSTVDRIWTTLANKRCGAGDIVLTVRAPVGSVARASKRACLGRGVCGLKPLGYGPFLYYALVLRESLWEDVEQGSTFSAANSAQVAGFPIAVPTDKQEQRAIATILSDMDAEIAALERRLDKTRAIKQGMMQQLLTGSIRLPIPETAADDEAAS